MRFLYRRSSFHLENISSGCQIVAASEKSLRVCNAHQRYRIKLCNGAGARHSPTAWSVQMMDVILLALGLSFFALTVGYTIACDRL